MAATFDNSLDNNPTFVEGGAPPPPSLSGVPVVLDDNAVIVNAATYDGATLTLARDGGANPDDVFGSTGTLLLSEAQVLLQESAPPPDAGTVDVIVGAFTSIDGMLVITFNANATEDRVNAVLQQLTYANGSQSPPPSVTIDFTFDDGQGPAAGSITVGITATNDPPVLDLVAPLAAYQPGSPGIVLSPDVAVSDPDSPNLASATVSITDGLIGDVLSADPGGTGIVVSYDSGAHVLTLSGALTLDQYRQVLDTVTYSSTAADPSNGGANPTRNIEWQLNDGGGSNSLSAVQVTTLHFTPSLDLDGGVAGTGFSTAFTENGASVPVADTDAVIVDSGGGLTFAAVVLTNAKAGDSLTVAGPLPGGITAVANASSGQITVSLSGPASPANYQAALRQVVFGSTSENPDTTPRDVTVVVGDDAVTSNTAHATITVTAVNDAPVAQDGTAAGNENSPVSGNAVATDVDNTPAQLTYSLVGANGGAQHGTVALNGDGSFTYTPATDFAGSDSFAFKANDSAADSNVGTITVAVNDSPVAQDGTAAGNEDAPISGNAVATDTDNTSAQLTYGLVGQNGGAQHGTVALNADGSFTYTPAADFNGSDSFAFKANDGAADSNTATVAVTVSAVNDPVTSSAPLSATVAEDGSVAIAGLSIADVDAALAPGGQYGVTLSATHGTVTLATLAGLAFDAGDGAADASM
ncbi:MAG TPA: Ig-like domain-containing protein, partial [Beijerinckiaceae bacterium]